LLTVRFDLIPDHLRVRAERFLPLVRDACRDNALPVSLVMAMIHVESAFNPRAVSSANAIGLMQVVAATGGREASHALHGRDREPSRRELTDPEHNIALGCRYLAVLRDRYFVRVSSPRSREYCMISAYNAGPGSVSRALAGSNDTSGVPGAIRDLTPSQVRGRLEQRLSSREGRAYLGKVLSRRELYAT
jgi:membrane-bound lytic murein transglycosylase C